MISFHSVLPEIAEREVRCIQLGSAPETAPDPELPPPGEYAFTEFYCEDLNCDCRRVFLQVLARHDRGRVWASINYGWEDESFYRKRMSYDPEAPGLITQGSLDPINTQSKYSKHLLNLFQNYVLDEAYRQRLRRHHDLFREELRRRQNKAKAKKSAPAGPVPTGAPTAATTDSPLSPAMQERFTEVAALLEQFGQKHLDPELTGFARELWKRVCRKESLDCSRGKPAMWAGSVTHVIARMNFLFDRSQPVTTSLAAICDFFQTSKNTVGSKATEIERSLRLRDHCEPGLCRREFLESFTVVRTPNGLLLPWKVAKQLGHIPPDAPVEDFL